MCLGIPGKLVEVLTDSDVRMGRVQFGGITKLVCLEHVQDAKVGDYVLVHVGFALSKIDEREAHRVFDYLAQLGALDELKAEAQGEDA